MSKKIETGGPAFPWGEHGTHLGGMTLREYAAIKLRVPESGDDWLDDMIRKSLRDELAAKAMQGLCADPTNHKLFDDMDDMAANAYLIAGAMLRAREAKP